MTRRSQTVSWQRRAPADLLFSREEAAQALEARARTKLGSACSAVGAGMYQVGGGASVQIPAGPTRRSPQTNVAL